MKVKAKMIKDDEDAEDSGDESNDSVNSGEEIKKKGKTSNQFNFTIKNKK